MPGKLPTLFLAAGLSACSRNPTADPAPQPTPTESEAAAPEGDPLARVRSLDVPHDATLAPWPEAPVRALRTEPLEPERAEAVWRYLYARRTSLGLTPVVVRTELDDLQTTASEYAAARVPTEPAETLDRLRAIQAASRTEHRTWCESHNEEHPDALLDCKVDHTAQALVELRDAEVLGEVEPAAGFAYPTFDASLAASLGENEIDYEIRKVRVVLLEAEPWEVTAVFGFGGWNECPPTTDQVAIHKDWFARYGASIAFVSRDVLEFYVERPPSTVSGAKRLAEEQFLYCTDIVHQGVGTTPNLAAALQAGHYWYFWWD